jgi:hypothetical protein
MMVNSQIGKVSEFSVGRPAGPSIDPSITPKHFAAPSADILYYDRQID